MKFLIDNALSPVLSGLLCEQGHDSKHVRDFGISHATDENIFDFAEREERVIVSADTDFGYILKTRKVKKPSFILFRKSTALDPKIIVTDILFVIEKSSYDLQNGSIIVIEDERIRIRELPLLK